MNPGPKIRHPGPKIREIREAKGMTVEGLALSTGLNGGNLSKLERGLLGCTNKTLVKIATGLGVEIYEFYIDLDEQQISVARAYGLMTAEERLQVHDVILRSKLARTEPDPRTTEQQPRAVVRSIKERRRGRPTEESLINEHSSTSCTAGFGPGPVTGP